MAILHVTLATRDLERSIRFFQDVFGWRRLERESNVAVPFGWLEMTSGQEIHLLEVPSFEPSAFEREYGRHVAISAPKGDFPQLKLRLQGNGAELIDAIRETSYQRFFFRDPNGYVFEVVEESQPE